jgi:hypothetical protein
MNAAQRKTLSEKISIVEDLISELQNIRDEEQEKYDNMPEGLQSGDKGEAIQQAVDNLDSAISAAEECRDGIENACA